MYLVTYVLPTRGQEPSIAFWLKEKDRVVDILQAEQRYLGATTLPSTMRELIDNSGTILPRLRMVHDAALADNGGNGHLPLADVRLRAPYTNPPRNILCIGLNYTEHLKELDRPLLAEQKLPETPFVFTKPCTAIAHPDDILDVHNDITLCYDYEVELAVIIGKSGKNIRKEDALEHVFGYSIVNDLSARDLQRLTTQWYRGKCLDGSAPFGPCIATKDAIPDPQNLAISSRINGELRQDSHTARMLFDVATLISVVSTGSTLLPGDIISTGTPSGVGMSFQPPRYLKSGDCLKLEIENIGVLRNTMR